MDIVKTEQTIENVEDVDMPITERLLQNRPTEYTDNEKEEQRRKWSNYNSPLDPRKKFNDFPTYFFAGFWVRLFAFTMDIICIIAIQNILFSTVLFAVKESPQGAFLNLYNLISLVIYLAYFILLTKLNRGQTIGKMIFGLQVVCFKEAELSWQTVLVREGACRFVLQVSLLFLGYLPAAFSKSKQHVGDLLSDTSVVTLNTIKAFNGVKY